MKIQKLSLLISTQQFFPFKASVHDFKSHVLTYFNIVCTKCEKKHFLVGAGGVGEEEANNPFLTEYRIQ